MRQRQDLVATRVLSWKSMSVAAARPCFAWLHVVSARAVRCDATAQCATATHATGAHVACAMAWCGAPHPAFPQLEVALSDDNMVLMGHFGTMLRVLQRLNYVDADRTVQLKGRVACEVTALLSSFVAVWLRWVCVLGRSTRATLSL